MSSADKRKSVPSASPKTAGAVKRKKAPIRKSPVVQPEDYGWAISLVHADADAGASPFDPNQVSLPAIQARLDAMAAAMAGKALREPEASFTLRSGTALRVLLSWQGRPTGWDCKVQGFDTLDEADAWIAALPTPEQKRLQEFLASLDETIQLGKKADVDVEVINPMLEILKRISKSAITHQPKGA